MPARTLTLASRLLLAAASCAALAACGHDAASTSATTPAAQARSYDSPAWPTAAIADPTRLGFTAEGLQALDARMKQAVDNKEIAGINYALIKDGEVATFKAVGNQILGGAPMTDKTLFRVRSTGKTITAVAMMQL